jgi:hypothetical protein
MHPFYANLWSSVSRNIPNGSKALGVNGYGGRYMLPDGSQIIFIPAHEKDNAEKLIKSNTRFHILKWLSIMGIPKMKDAHIKLLDEYITKEV